ncbi:MAG: hypothetical protein DSM106950_09050 [Stigonema ocellatum SAG 48.90 = DSM 106950]|nr:hypothetical protein [Stigonema ocellatum SAG 48.90 = DSM 106950]
MRPKSFRSDDEAEAQVYQHIANRLAELIDDVSEVGIDRDERRELLSSYMIVMVRQEVSNNQKQHSPRNAELWIEMTFNHSSPVSLLNRHERTLLHVAV